MLAIRGPYGSRLTLTALLACVLVNMGKFWSDVPRNETVPHNGGAPVRGVTTPQLLVQTQPQKVTHRCK